MEIIIEIKEDNDICSICLQEFYGDTKNYKHSECKNYFHTECILEWFKINKTCPICRISINLNEIENNFNQLQQLDLDVLDDRSILYSTVCGYQTETFLCGAMVVNIVISFTLGILFYILS